MELTKVREILNNISYWQDLFRFEFDSRTQYLTTVFKLEKMEVNQNIFEEDCFYIGEFVKEFEYRGKNIYCGADRLIFDLYYKELQYSNTLYIDYCLNGNTYTKVVRMKKAKGQTLNDEDIKNKIKLIIYEFEKLYMLTISLKNYEIDNSDCLNIEKNMK